MLANISRILAAVIALVMFALFLITPPTLISDTGEETAMLPPCDVDEGLPFIDDDEVTCYWGMSEDIVELVKAVDSVDVTVDVTWEKDGVWVGAARATEANARFVTATTSAHRTVWTCLQAVRPRTVAWTASGDVRFVVEASQGHQRGLPMRPSRKGPETPGSSWLAPWGWPTPCSDRRVIDWVSDAVLTFS